VRLYQSIWLSRVSCSPVLEDTRLKHPGASWGLSSEVFFLRSMGVGVSGELGGTLIFFLPKFIYASTSEPARFALDLAIFHLSSSKSTRKQ
jgi:hypothetical protein